MLVPGGVLLVEELHGGFIQWQDNLIGTSHPPAAAFDWVTFRTGLEAAGFDVAAEGEILPFGPVRSFCAIKRRQTSVSSRRG